LKPLIEQELQRRGIPVLHTYKSFGSSVGTRIGLDLRNRSDIEKLEKSPIHVDRRTFFIQTPRFIEPCCGWDVVIAGTSGLTGFEAAMNRWINTLCNGNVIVSSDMVLNGDAYVVTLSSWEAVNTLLAAETPQIDGVPQNMKLSKPIQLYWYNVCGCPAPRFLKDDDSRGNNNSAIQRQIDAIRSQGLDIANTFNELI
ncbi:hypothetical protein PQX77_013576, partial [Marasmius sp. AFHP31]